MFCSGCGQQLAAGQAFCPQCGRPVAPAVPPVPVVQYQLDSYRSNVKALAVVWYVYAGLSLLLGFAGLAFVHTFFSGGFGQWMNGPQPPVWVLPMVVHFAWIFIVLHVGLAALVGYGLMEHAHWGRILAIIAGFLSLLKFPFGTALGIWTLVVLLGYRNAALYEQM